MKKENTVIITTLILMMLAIIILLGIVFISFPKDKKENLPESINKNVELRIFKDNEYYIIKDDYKGDYDIQTQGFGYTMGELDNVEELEFPDTEEIMSYEKYCEYCNKWNLEQSYTDESKSYIVFSSTKKGAVSINVRLAAMENKDDSINLYIWDDPYGVTADITFYTIIIPTDEKDKKINSMNLFSECEYKNLKKYGYTSNPYEETDKKPVIYLYPEKETDITVRLKNDNLITTSYPKYKDSWNVKSSPNGDLLDLKTNRKLYCLYYESKSIIDFSVVKEGFVVKSEDSAQFLEEKLEILGLNEKETQEFIIYWLPILESNKYNYIRFASKDEIETNMPLEITPKPNTTIRILMTFKGLDKPINVKEQYLEKTQRTGYAAVEWGAVEIK